MSIRPALGREREKEAPPARQQENSAEPIITDESIPADNRYAPAGGILAPVRAPMSGVQ
jgi:hypothetical protein